jgi:OmpA-OmpF porin, OOP family
MIHRLSVLAAAMMVGLALPVSVAPALAQQDAQAVRDALNRAQSGAERRAVEDLINRLRGAPAQAAPAAPGAAPATVPAAVPIPSATGTPSAQPAAAAPATTAVGAPVQAATPPGSATAPRNGRPTGPASAAPGIAPSGTPGSTTPVAGAVSSSPASVAVSAPPVTVPRGGDLMAKAPEIAEKMDLPRADIEVFFAFNSAEITPEAMNTLVVMGQALADPRLAGQRFIIGGHTDGKGRPEFNLALSKRRAEAVRKFIIEHYRIEPVRLIARGFGKSQLKNPGAPTADENRRVQVINWTRMVASAKPSR